MIRRYLFLLGMVIGIGLGLAYAWVIDPVKLTESSPANTVSSYKRVWLVMASEAYAQDGDWDRTRGRLDSLRDPNLNQTIAALFDEANNQGQNSAARALARLTVQLGAPTTSGMAIYLQTPSALPGTEPAPIAPVTPSPIVAFSPLPTPTPSPTAGPTPTPTPPLATTYQIIRREPICQSESITPQIQVTIQDVAGKGLPGKEVWITWDGGADRFVTGLKPEIDPGYGDFDMALDQTYNVSIDKPTSIIVAGLHADVCTDGHLSWRLVIRPNSP